MKRMLIAWLAGSAFAQKNLPELKPEQNETLRRMIGGTLTVKALKPRRHLPIFPSCGERREKAVKSPL